jgi:hypothetical protein
VVLHDDEDQEDGGEHAVGENQEEEEGVDEGEVDEGEVDEEAEVALTAISCGALETLEARRARSGNR